MSKYIEILKDWNFWEQEASVGQLERVYLQKNPSQDSEGVVDLFEYLGVS